MNKNELLETLRSHTLIRLQPSPVSGIGVFAIAVIKKGERRIFSNDTSDWIAVTKQEVAALPVHSRVLIENFCLYDEENYFVPEYGFKMIDPIIYLNHSDTPNVRSINDGAEFEALRDIVAGEELFVDYADIVAN